MAPSMWHGTLPPTHPQQQPVMNSPWYFRTLLADLHGHSSPLPPEEPPGRVNAPPRHGPTIRFLLQHQSCWATPSSLATRSVKTVAGEGSLWVIASCESQENQQEADARNFWSIRLLAQCTSPHITGYFGSVNSWQNFKLYIGLVPLLPWKAVAIFLGWKSPAMSSKERE